LDRKFGLQTSEESSAEKYPPKRFDVELFIVHPALTPQEISALLGLDARFAHCVGTQRRNPKGDLLSGVYPDTRWRHSRRYESPDQWFVDKVEELTDYLTPYRLALAKMKSAGGKCQIIIQFLDGYFGDTLPKSLLQKLADLDLDLGIESYGMAQNIRRTSGA
jgi:hypothetical protein